MVIGRKSGGSTAVDAGAAPRYTAPARVLHWLIAALAIVLLGLGLVMKRGTLALEQKFWLYQLHKSLGLMLLALMAARILWRWRHRPPPRPAGTPPLQHILAGLTHLGLYLLLIALPVSGWLMISAATFPVPTRLFGLLPVPHLTSLAELPAAARKPWEALFKDMHLYLAVGLAVLASIHITVALDHHFRSKDSLLRRMLSLAVLALGLSVSLAGPASASDGVAWRVDPKASSLRFEASAGGQPVAGTFRTFSASIRLDPANPTAADVEVKIETGSVDGGNADVDAALKDEIWLDTKRQPQAVYRAQKATRQADGRLELDGALTLKGRTVPLLLPFTLAITLAATGPKAVAVGELTLSRNAFGIGPQEPIAGLVIADEVKLKLRIEAEFE